jgi:hypothetical protein
LLIFLLPYLGQLNMLCECHLVIVSTRANLGTTILDVNPVN